MCAFQKSRKHEALLLLVDLPNEILLNVTRCLSITDLISLCRVHRKLYTVGIQTLAMHRSASILRLYFDQESRWRFAVDMILVEATPTRFSFTPIDNCTTFCLYSSRVLRRPMISKVALEEYVVQRRSVPLDVGTCGDHHTALLGPSACFKYYIHKRRQENTRERWISPLKFECEPRWLCQRSSWFLWEKMSIFLMQSNMMVISKLRFAYDKNKNKNKNMKQEECKEILDGKSCSRSHSILSIHQRATCARWWAPFPF